MNLRPTAVVRAALMAASTSLLLSACAGVQPQSTVSRDLVSGVTASNGGGMEPTRFGTFGSASASSPTFDTGSMSYPEPLPQGNLRSTRVR